VSKQRHAWVQPGNRRLCDAWRYFPPKEIRAKGRVKCVKCLRRMADATVLLLMVSDQGRPHGDRC